MTLDAAQSPPKWSAWPGVLGGFLIAVFLYVPLALMSMQFFEVPHPSPVPIAQRDPSVTVPVEYWWSWALSFVILALPGIALLAEARARRTAWGYVIALFTVGGVLGAAFMSFEYYGFAPS
ncbi:hypothetical protein IEU95_08690 [Hoyosella rhizosphaerae]|uniref:Uncharacterized protein n=1 Tax=Hoyosella rhizosphaerae TaxID=1755582 RepID=A0A916U3B9_9ACTN|nr:hypothetical protein [Hoyosella rhizosphaerae]MBN4926906.1 hypothetical protein [Hoyosella rhizosphaerae]GGC55590.1 hypothetical protein GCM10011410_04970 [Hoyosella rhizosphaerae]